MNDLKKIIEEAFESGWIAAKEYFKLKEEGSYLIEEIAYIHSLEIVLDDEKDSPPILTREIVQEIINLGKDLFWSIERHQFHSETQFLKDVDNLLKKYNLKGKE